MLVETPVERLGPHRRVVVEVLALGAVVLVGVWLRLGGVTSHGLWRDDAWVAMTGRVSLGTALRMGATAPGFTLIERSWVLLDPGSSAWAQALPLALGVAGIVAMFLLARYVGLSSWLALAASAFVALSPVAITYSTHVKQYSLDVVLACALLGLGEAARRAPDRRRLGLLGAASCVGLVLSASVVVVIAGVWAMLVLASFGDRQLRTRVVVAGAITGAVCASVGMVFYSHLSTTLNVFWSQQHRFLELTPPHRLVAQLASMVSTAILKTPATPKLSTWVGIAVSLVALVGLTAGAKLWSSGLAVAAALGAATLGLIPWGTGRTDEVLYPAVALLVGFGVERLARAAAERMPGVPVEAIVAVMVGLALTAGMLRTDIVHPARYPAVDAKLLMKKVAQHERPGDLVYVSSSSRYPWVLQSPDRPKLVFGSGWGAGYTVASTRPDQFVAPSYSWEAEFHPSQWAHETTGAQRLWFVGGGFPPGRRDHEYRAILAAGWRPVTVLRASGSVAVLMTHR